MLKRAGGGELISTPRAPVTSAFFHEKEELNREPGPLRRKRSRLANAVPIIDGPCQAHDGADVGEVAIDDAGQSMRLLPRSQRSSRRLTFPGRLIINRPTFFIAPGHPPIMLGMGHAMMGTRSPRRETLRRSGRLADQSPLMKKAELRRRAGTDQHHRLQPLEHHDVNEGLPRSPLKPLHDRPSKCPSEL